jgi:hypothetical protein
MRRSLFYTAVAVILVQTAASQYDRAARDAVGDDKEGLPDVRAITAGAAVSLYRQQ